MSISTLAYLLFFMVSCSSTSYKLSRDGQKCEGSTLTVEEQMDKIGRGAAKQGTICYDRKIQLSKGRHVHRMICNVSGRNVTFNSYAGDKKACELAQIEILKNPRFGLEDVASTSFFRGTQQMQESNLWFVRVRDKSCIQYSSGGIEKMINELEQETGEQCEVISRELSGQPAKLVSCGGNTKTGVIVTESESSCQMIIKSLWK